MDRSTAARNAANDGQLALIGVGSKIQLRTGAPSLTASGTLLYEFDAEAVPTSSGGSATITSADPTNDALADGTIGHIRIGADTRGRVGSAAFTFGAAGAGETTPVSPGVPEAQPYRGGGAPFTPPIAFLDPGESTSGVGRATFGAVASGSGRAGSAGAGRSDALARLDGRGKTGARGAARADMSARADGAGRVWSYLDCYREMRRQRARAEHLEGMIEDVAAE